MIFLVSIIFILLQQKSNTNLIKKYLTNFEIQKSYQNEPKLNGFYSRNNLPKIKDRAYFINLDEFKSIRIHWLVLHVNGNNGSLIY